MTAQAIASTDGVPPAGTAEPTMPLGLTDQEARDRRAKGQGNQMHLASSRSYAQIIRENMFTFINVTLLSVGVILIVMNQTKDAILASGLVILNGLVGIIQEVRAKRRLDRIALLNRAKATILRDGAATSLDPDEIVVGDVLLVNPGDQIFVDGSVVGPGRIEVDESLLTGESDPVAKCHGDPIFAGSYCLSGSGAYEAEKVGAQSKAAAIAVGARVYKATLTPLQETVNMVVRYLLVIAGFFLVMILLASWIWDFPFQDTVLSAAVVLGIVPSGMFLMIIVTYSMAAVRLAQQDALIQQTNAVESLSNVNVFCMDKTGTLTANRLNLVDVQPIGQPPFEPKAVLGAATASASGGTKTSEAIITALGVEKVPLLDEIPFTSARKWSAVAADRDELRGVFAIGAPEFLAPHTVGGRDLKPPAEWAAAGRRVLLFAASPDAVRLHDGSGEPQLPPNLAPVAWLAFTDELRPNSRETIAGFGAAGITLKVISGDNPETVAALARQAGLPADAKLVSGLELAEMSDAEFAQAAHDATIFGRVTPEQKERLVDALRKQGFYVAMTGDGVNDVLSLKKAQLGVAMQSGSQAARNVADIILLNDSFGALPAAFREGQRIRRGLQDVLSLFLTRVFTVAFIILTALMVEAGFPFSPGHISLLTLLTVGIPTFGLALWAKPGAAPASLGRSLVRFVLPASITLGVAAFAVYALAYFFNDIDLIGLRGGGVLAVTEVPLTDRIARDSLAHILILAGLVLVFFAAPPTKWWAVLEETTGDWRPALLALAMVPLYVTILAVPMFREFFGLHLLTWADYIGIGVIVAIWTVVVRWTWQANVFGRMLGYDPDPPATTTAPTTAPAPADA
jgi:cation-transporting ATPase E